MKDKNISFTQKLRKENMIITNVKETQNKEEKKEMKEENNNPTLPILIIPETILLPNTNMTLNVDKPHTEKLIENMTDDATGIILSPKYIPTNENPALEFYEVGTILQIEDINDIDDQYILEIKVKDKVRVTKVIEENGLLQAEYQIIPEEDNLSESDQSKINKIINENIEKISSLIPNSELYAKQIIEKQDTKTKVAEVFPYLKLTTEKKQELLEINSVKIRSFKVAQLLLEQKEAMFLQVDLAKRMNDKMSKAHKEGLLREQQKMIEEEIAQLEGSDTDEAQSYEDQIKEANMPEEVEKAALKELRKLKRMGQNSAEENIIRTYIETLIDLSWNKEEPQEIDIQKAQQQLDNDHYGLEKIKQRIIEHLAVMKLKNEKQGSILLLVGPPGTGKTSLGKSIAKALNRPYIRASLGGVSDESEIRGHRRTYVGALPGRIINGMRKAGTSNPVFVLDEIDKLTDSLHGSPKSALLEVLDPEQNDSFSDHYLEVPYNLSDVFFIATANSLEDIPEPLRDRLEIIQLESYTTTEKKHIAQEHLLKEVLEEHGLNDGDIILDDEAVEKIIGNYTREAGVRSLKRELASITRKITQKIVTGKATTPFHVKAEDIEELLGHEKAHYDMVEKSNPSGVVTGLAWTPSGGDVLFVESVMTPGKEELKLTGQLGDVMKESAQIAQSLVKSRLSSVLEDSDIEKHDIHIHFPEGAIKKDGPSAGVTLATTIASLLTNIPVDSTLAMTGEISLQGKVLPVGGIKEKVIAAHRAGIKVVLLPEKNMKDVEDIPEEVRSQLEFKPMKTIDDVLQEALGIKIPESTKLNINQDKINQMRI